MWQKYCRFLVFSFLCLVLATETSHAWFLSKHERTLLLVPARPRVIQLAFDMIRLRPIDVVSFRGDASSSEPVLYLRKGSEWQYVSVADFSDNKFLKEPVSRVIIIGNEKTVPSVLLQCVSWCSDVEWIETLNIAELINGFDRTFKFKNREWKWLARRYGLTLIDTNADRRSYNPYKTRRSELPLKTMEFEQDADEIAPAVLIIEETVGEPGAETESESEETP